MAIFINAFNDFDIDKDRSGKRMGARIRTIRESIGMSRAKLGELVGLDQNRIQQYENGWRKPKPDLLKKFAAALGVHPMALLDPVADSYAGVMFALFQMEENFGLKVLKKDGAYYLRFRDENLDKHLEKWYEKQRELEEALHSLTDEERKKECLSYNMFEWNYTGKTL